MILSLDILLDLNNKMLKRGSPEHIDFAGYNKFDFDVLAHIQENEASMDKVAFVIASRLKRYANTQIPKISSLPITKEDLEETAKHYHNLMSNETFKINVLQPDLTNADARVKDWFKLTFNYNTEFIQTIKSVCGKGYYMYKSEDKSWYVHREKIMEVMTQLDLCGANVTEALHFIRERLSPGQVILFKSKNK